MIVQLYKSLAHFYRRHYSEFELNLLIFFIDMIAFIRLIRDNLFYLLNQDPNNQKLLQEQIGAWKKMLTSAWYRANNQNSSQYDEQ
jgi:hypothetical protein